MGLFTLGASVSRSQGAGSQPVVRCVTTISGGKQQQVIYMGPQLSKAVRSCLFRAK